MQNLNGIMFNVVDDILYERDRKRITALILLEFSKAFDILNHELLAAILHYIGFAADAYNLMTS